MRIIPLVLLAACLIATQAWPANVHNSDADYSIKIAVTVNEDDFIMGKLEYSNIHLNILFN